MAYVDFMSPLHKKTVRDYVARVNEINKAEAAEKAKQWGFDYWDGDRKINYGGYNYMPGRWQKVTDLMAKQYGIKPGDTILDVGCGKGFMLYDFTLSVPGVKVTGLDISEYAIDKAKEEVKPFLMHGNANYLPFPDNSFDLVISINTLHNLHCYDLEKALKEIQRVGKNHKYLCVESYRNEVEKMNLLYWQVTCESFCTPEEWEWWFKLTGYTGDHSFIYFE